MTGHVTSWHYNQKQAHKDYQVQKNNINNLQASRDLCQPMGAAQPTLIIGENLYWLVAQ